MEHCANGKATGEQPGSSTATEVGTRQHVGAGYVQDGKSPDPLLRYCPPHDLCYPSNPLLAGPPNRGTTQEDDKQAIGTGKEDLEKLTRADSCKRHNVQLQSFHGDGYLQLSSSPFSRGRPLFPCPDPLETSRLMKSPPACNKQSSLRGPKNNSQAPGTSTHIWGFSALQFISTC